MSPSTLPRVLPRAVVGSAAALVALTVGIAPAGAAVGLTIPLSPPDVGLLLSPEENYAPFTEDGGGELVPVEVGWGGALDLQLPVGVDASDATYLLETGAETDQEPTRTLSSEASGVGHLDVTGSSDGLVRITLPTDASSGPLGLLTVAGLTGAAPGVELGFQFDDALHYLLEFTGTGTAVVSLAPASTSYASLPCTLVWLAEAPDPDPEAGPESDCAPYAAAAGTTIGVTLPADSLLRTVGLDALTDVTALLFPLEPEPDLEPVPENEPDDGSWDGFDDGYTDGLAAGTEAGPGTAHVPSRGPSFDAARAAAAPGYDAGYEEGHALGWEDATHVDPDADEDGETSTWELFLGQLDEGDEPREATLPEAVPTGLTPAATARVAAAARALDDASAGAATAAAVDAVEQSGPETVEQADEDVVEAAPFDDGLLPVTATAAGIELTLPASAPAGEHVLLLAVGADDTTPSSIVSLLVDVTAAPAGAAPVVAPVAALPGQPAVAPALNPGLASNTGWTEPAAGGSTALVALGGTAVLAAGVGAAVVLRPRRRPAAATQD